MLSSLNETFINPCSLISILPVLASLLTDNISLNTGAENGSLL